MCHKTGCGKMERALDGVGDRGSRPNPATKQLCDFGHLFPSHGLLFFICKIKNFV